MTDLQRLDWMEDYPEKAIAVLMEENNSMIGHMLRQRIDEAMTSNATGVKLDKKQLKFKENINRLWKKWKCGEESI